MLIGKFFQARKVTTIESTVVNSSKSSFRSYFAMIPVFKGRKKSAAERNIIKIIHESNICQSSPVLKTLLIENVRICCIVVESSGKQSVKVLCASVPLILSLISKANPRLEKVLKNANIASCLKVLQESDFESVLSNVYYTTITVHEGIKQFYPMVCINIFKDSLLRSEDLLIYLFKQVLQVLKSGIAFFNNDIIPVLRNFYCRNYASISRITNLIPDILKSLMKYCILATSNFQKSSVIAFKIFKKTLLHLFRIVKHFYFDSACRDSLGKLYYFLKLCVAYLNSTEAYYYMEKFFLPLFEISKPYLWKYFQRLFEIIKTCMLTYSPIVRDGVKYIIKESIPLLQKSFEGNFESIINACDFIKDFLTENSHYLKDFCCQTFKVLYSSAFHLFDILQTVLPYVIQYSNEAAISFVRCSIFVSNKCMHLCYILFNNVFKFLQNHRKSFCRLCEKAVEVLKMAYKIFLKIQPYIVLSFRIASNELIQLIHVLSPTLLACLHEGNSSVFYASHELVAKSFLAVKRVMPSFYYAAKAVVPPTVRAANEVIKSSKNSVVVVYPALYRSVLTIRPEVQQCIVVLLSDGKASCMEVISVTCSASYHLKDAARSFSSRLPILCKAFYEVWKTTSFAVVEVSTTSVNAKCIMNSDFKRVRKHVHNSLLLAEEELIVAYTELAFEINSIIPKTEGNVILSDSQMVKYINNCVAKMSSLIKCIDNALDSFAENSTVYFKHNLKILVDASIYLFFWTTNILRCKVCKSEALHDSFSKVFFYIFANISDFAALNIQHLCDYTSSILVNIKAKAIHNVTVNAPKAWNRFKSNVRTIWKEACKKAPEIWDTIEHLASLFWEFILENVPGAWTVWKITCSEIWQFINYIAPHVWDYLCSATPVLWSSGRQATQYFWNVFIKISSSTWHHSVSFSSECWMLSETYLPIVWFNGCAEMKKGWDMSCCLAESWWNFAVETCFTSWNSLHHSIARTWRKSLVFTKTTYCLFTTTGSVLQKSYCTCLNYKNHACVMFIKAPEVNDSASSNSRVSKLTKMFHVLGNRNEMIFSCADDLNAEETRFSFHIKDLFVGANYFSCAKKLLNYEILFPSKLFSSSRKELPSN